MRGYQKRVIYLKNTGSRHFEEAYFVIRSGEEASPDKMIDEANRIIEENEGGRRGGFFYSKRWHILAFFVGAATALTLCFALGLIYFLR